MNLKNIHLLTLCIISNITSFCTDAIKKDRATGAFLGNIIGDAFGASREFSQPGANPSDTNYPKQTDLVEGGCWKLKASQWTDDSSMLMSMADSLAVNKGWNGKDCLIRFALWKNHGMHQCTNDVGTTTAIAIDQFTNNNIFPPAPATNSYKDGDGGLIGSFYGTKAIPRKWLKKLHAGRLVWQRAYKRSLYQLFKTPSASTMGR